MTVTCAEPQRQLGEWPMIGRDVQSNRSQPLEHGIDAAAAATLAPAWTFDANRWTHGTNNEITGYPVEKDGCVYVGSSTGNAANGSHLPGWVFSLNAANGDVVWATRVPGGVYSTLAVADGVVYAFVSVVSSPRLVALDQRTGKVLWSTVVDRQFGADAVSSPVVHDGLVWVGVSGTAAEGSDSDRTAFQGSSGVIAAKPLVAPAFSPPTAPRASGRRHYRPGEIIRKAWTIPAREWPKGYAGGAQWGTVSVDPATGYGYVGTGNPFNYDSEHRNTNALLKLDLDRRRATFGQVVASYKGDVESVVRQGSDVVPCSQVAQVSGATGLGAECLRLDLDFGATPNLVRDTSGRTLVVAGQKSGVVHFVDARTMRGVRTVRLGVSSPVGGMVGSGATDGTSVFGSHTLGGYLYSVSRDGVPGWVAPTADAVHWGPPVTLANGILYVVDLKGFLDGYLAATGTPVLHRPLQLGSDPATLTSPPLSWGGTTVARGTVFASVGVGLTSAGLPSMPNGFVIAFRPSLPV
jgi:polyvinyl alcohol dehydrogenase (cytochrome)